MGSAHTVGVGGSLLSARTRIRRHDELESGGKMCDRIGPVDADHAGLERLAQRVECRRLELGSLVEEQHSV
jgi:hypothetical protein